MSNIIQRYTTNLHSFELFIEPILNYYLLIIKQTDRIITVYLHSFLGIVVWGTATLPYLVLTILLIRGLMLPGSLTGITYYLQPELYRLLDTQVHII